VIFDPAVYPMDTAWIDGKIPADHYRHTRPGYYGNWGEPVCWNPGRARFSGQRSRSSARKRADVKIGHLYLQRREKRKSGARETKRESKERKSGPPQKDGPYKPRESPPAFGGAASSGERHSGGVCLRHKSGGEPPHSKDPDCGYLLPSAPQTARHLSCEKTQISAGAVLADGFVDEGFEFRAGERDFVGAGFASVAGFRQLSAAAGGG